MILHPSGIASPKIWVGLKIFWGAKTSDFRRVTLVCLEKRFSKHTMTVFSKNVGGHGLFSPPATSTTSYLVRWRNAFSNLDGNKSQGYWVGFDARTPCVVKISDG